MNSQPPIACDLSAINDNELKVHRADAQAIFKAIEEIRETPDGYEFKLPVETKLIQQAGAFIAREHLCCPFFEYTLTIQANCGPVWLKLGGREGVKSYIRETLLPQLDIIITN